MTNVGLYRDDGLALIPGTNRRDADIARKRLFNVFRQISLKITVEINHQIVNFLDITLNLNNGKFTPYRKPNNDPLYINSSSNHPPAIIRQVPKCINQCISSLSSVISLMFLGLLTELVFELSHHMNILKFMWTEKNSTPLFSRVYVPLIFNFCT